MPAPGAEVAPAGAARAGRRTTPRADAGVRRASPPRHGRGARARRRALVRGAPSGEGAAQGSTESMLSVRLPIPTHTYLCFQIWEAMKTS